jgi:hypothetical protein
MGADKKTLHCVDKIHFRLFRPTFISGGVWTSEWLRQHRKLMRGALRLHQKPAGNKLVRTLNVTRFQ